MKTIHVNLFPKEDFIKAGFKFEKMDPDDPNDEYYGWLILDNIKFKWFSPCFSDEMYYDTSLWAYGYINNKKTDFSDLYFLSSVKEIHDKLTRLSEQK